MNVIPSNRWLRLFVSAFLVLALVCVAPAPDAYGAKKKASSSKTATAKTSSKKKSSSSKSSSKSSNKKSSNKKSSAKSSSKKSSSKKTSSKKSSSKKSSSRYSSARASSHASSADTAPASENTLPSTQAARTRSADFRNVDSAADRAPALSPTRRKIKVEKPDLDIIREKTLDPASEYYFPKLQAKYEKNDTSSMKPEDFRNFYLGYMFQEDFDPYRISPYSSATDELRQKPTHTKAEIDTIEKYSLLALEDNPFDLRQMSFLIHVLKENKKFMRAKIWEYRLENLLGAIKSTGTGDSPENAWYVMYPAHEYDMVQLLGYEAVDAKYIEPGYDYLEVQPDETDKRKRDKSAKGFYFNVMIPQQQYELKHPDDLVAVAEGAEVVPPGADADDASADDIPADDEEAADIP